MDFLFLYKQPYLLEYPGFPHPAILAHYFLGKIFSNLSLDAKMILYIFIVMYGFRVMFDFILSGRYRETSLGVLMFQPYLRIFIQQFVVILGSMFLAFGAGKFFMLIFVVIKIYAEIFMNFNRYLEKAEKLQKLKALIDKRNIKSDQ